MNLEEIKEKINLVEVVQKYVKLKRVGKYYNGFCPFHKEAKPSFYVSEELQIFKCFGCGEGGDLIKFLMKIENLDFKGVLEKLKEEYGLEFQTLVGEKKEIKKILEINYTALKFFRQELKKNQSALNYLKERGLNEKTIDEFELGFSPGNTLLRDYLYSLGYDYETINLAGLVDSKKYDRFQSRIIFPLRDERGRLVGFTGRIFPENVLGPKYLNSPETPLFKKSQFLYGLYQAKDYILQNKKVILVEGQFDFLLSWQNNLKNIVAVSGSALTIDHLRKLKKYVSEIVFAFDNDFAGFKAALRANFIAKRLNFQTFQLIYAGKDLGGYFLTQNREDLSLQKFEDWLLDYLIKNYNNKREILEILLPQLKILKPLEADEYLDKISKILNIAKDVLNRELAQIEELKFINEESKEEPLIFEEGKLEDQYAFKLASLIYFKKPAIDLGEIRKFLKKEYQELIDKIYENKLEEKEFLYFEMIKNFYQETNLDFEKELEKTIKNLKKMVLKKQLKELNEKLKLTPEDYDKIILEIQNIVNELKVLEKNQQI